MVEYTRKGKLQRQAMPRLIRLENVEMALRNLRTARDQLREAGANKAADYVARALKSAEGAERHARSMANGAQRATGWRVVYGETGAAWERIFSSEREARTFAAEQTKLGDVVVSVKKVVPGEPPQSMAAAIEATRGASNG